MGSTVLQLAPFGRKMQIRLDDALDAQLFLDHCRDWDNPSPDDAAPLQLEVQVKANGFAGDPFEISADERELQIAGPDVSAVAYGPAGQAHCQIAPSMCSDLPRLRNEILDPLVFTILAHHDRVPVHASAFLIDELAVVLAGPSGAGKSTLCRAADAAGLQVLCEDIVRVQRRPEPRFWGKPDNVHLLPGIGDDRAIGRRFRNGKTKNVLPLHSRAERPLCAKSSVLCVLQKGDQASLHPIAGEEAVVRLYNPEPGFDILGEKGRQAIVDVAGEHAFELTLSDDPADAIRLLAQNRDELRRIGSTR